MKPISAQFSPPQQQIPRASMPRRPRRRSWSRCSGDDGQTVIDTGTLQSIDTQVDQTTARSQLRAELPNDRLQMWPGYYRQQCGSGSRTPPQAIVVPTSAVQRGPNGTFVYVIGQNDTVSARNVTVTQQNDTDAVIASGSRRTSAW